MAADKIAVNVEGAASRSNSPTPTEPPLPAAARPCFVIITKETTALYAAARMLDLSIKSFAPIHMPLFKFPEKGASLSWRYRDTDGTVQRDRRVEAVSTRIRLISGTTRCIWERSSRDSNLRFIRSWTTLRPSQ